MAAAPSLPRQGAHLARGHRHERAAACYRAENLEGAMRHHLRAAQSQYEAWGATAKVKELRRSGVEVIRV